MKRLVLALALLLAPSLAWGQCTGVFPNNTVCANLTGTRSTPKAVPASSIGGTITGLTGDVTASGVGSVPATLATVNGSPGTYGSATNCITATANAKGLITGISTATCAPAFSSVTGNPTAAQIAGSATPHAVPVDVAGTPTWKVIGDCQDSTGNHLNYTQSTDSFSCGSTNSGASVIAPPSGRLTLQSSVPYQNGEEVGAVLVYYGSAGMYVPINGAMIQLGGQLALNISGTATGNLNDIFVANIAGTPTLCFGPNWTSSAPGASTRSAAGSLYLRIGNYFANSNGTPMTCTYGGGSSVSCVVGACTQLGVMYSTANGATTVSIAPASASGGSNTVMGLCNTYNSVQINVTSQDSTASWTYASASVREANNSASNRITWVACPNPKQIETNYIVSAANVGGGSVAATVGIGFNLTSGFSSGGPSGVLTQWAGSATNQGGMLMGPFSVFPLEGLNYSQALEQSSAVSITFFGTVFMRLNANVWY